MWKDLLVVWRLIFLAIGLAMPSTVVYAGSNHAAVEWVGSESGGLVSVYRVGVESGSAHGASRVANHAACQRAAELLFSGDSPSAVASGLSRMGARGCDESVTRNEVLGSTAVGRGYRYDVRVDIDLRTLRRRLQEEGLTVAADGLGPVVVVFEEFATSFAGVAMVGENVRFEWRKDILDTVEGLFVARGVEVVSRGAVDEALRPMRGAGGELPSSFREDVFTWAATQHARTVVEIKVVPREEGVGRYWSASVGMWNVSSARSRGSSVRRSAFIVGGAVPTLDLIEAAVQDAVGEAFVKSLD